MYRKILVACNSGPECSHALEACIRLTPPPSTEIHLLAVETLEPILLAADFAVAAVMPAEEERTAKTALSAALESGRQRLAAAGLAAIGHVEIGEPANVIAAMVSSLGIDLVIVGHAIPTSFAARWWRGTRDAVLIERVGCSVLIASGRHPSP